MTAETEQLLVAIPGRDGEATAISTAGVEEGVLEGVAVDLDHQPHALETPEIHTGVIVTFPEADVVVAGLTMADENPLRDRDQHQHHLDQAPAVAAHRATLINQTGDPRRHLQEGGEIDERGHDHPKETRTEAVPTGVRTEVAGADRRDPYHQTGTLL